MNRESSSNLSSNKGPTLWGILIAPTEQFERMVHRPRFGWALAAMMVVGSIVAALGAAQVAYSMVQETPIPEEAQMIAPDQIAMGAAFLGFVGSLVGIPVSLLLISLIQKLLLMLFQGEATYRQLFSLNTHLYLFTLFGQFDHGRHDAPSRPLGEPGNLSHQPGGAGAGGGSGPQGGS